MAGLVDRMLVKVPSWLTFVNRRQKMTMSTFNLYPPPGVFHKVCIYIYISKYIFTIFEHQENLLQQTTTQTANNKQPVQGARKK